MTCHTGGHRRHGGHHGCCCGFPRRFFSREEEKKKLEKYRDQLKNELAGVEEELKKMG
jgi:hypothetical protein